MCLLIILNCYFHPSTSTPPSVRADTSPCLDRDNIFCDNKLLTYEYARYGHVCTKLSLIYGSRGFDEFYSKFILELVCQGPGIHTLWHDVVRFLFIFFHPPADGEK